MELNELKKKISEQSLGISRISTKTKKSFVALAQSEFCNDYGMCLKFCLDQAIEYQIFKNTFFENIDMKLNHIIDLCSNEKKEKEPEKETIRLVSGRTVEKGVKK